jgi:NADH-quinone oxidoreductase subunit N
MALDLATSVRENLDSLAFFRPELVLSGGILLLFVLDLVWRRARARVALLSGAAIGLFAVAGAFLAAQPAAPAALFHGMVASDGFATFWKWLFLGAGALGVLVAALSREIAPERLGEFNALLTAVVLGMFLMASATDLLMMYLAIELVSMTSYVLAGFRRGDRRASEAALKYVIYGGVASGVMLFGISYLYGLAGTFSFDALGPRLAEALTAAGPALPAVRLAAVVAVVFVAAGVGYKIAAVPFHMWCPDVYEGAPTPFTAFLSVGPKAAGFALGLRLFLTVFSGPASAYGLFPALGDVPWPVVLAVVSMATMTLGNLVAISQTNLKRLLAYSSIAHAGYALMGVAAASAAGAQSVMIYLAVYLLMNLGAFGVVMQVAQTTGSESILDYRGLARRQPFTAILFVAFLLSLTGLPPFAGFIGKWYLFSAVWARTGGVDGGWFATLLVVAALNTAVSLYYYARVIRAMFLDAPYVAEPAPLRRSPGWALLLGGCGAAVLVLGVLPQPVIDWTLAALEGWPR